MDYDACRRCLGGRDAAVRPCRHYLLTTLFTLCVLCLFVQLRVEKVTTGAASKLARIKVVRKSIARVLTVYNQKQKGAVRCCRRVRIRFSRALQFRWSPLAAFR